MTEPLPKKLKCTCVYCGRVVEQSLLVTELSLTDSELQNRTTTDARTGTCFFSALNGKDWRTTDCSLCGQPSATMHYLSRLKRRARKSVDADLKLST